LERRWLVLLSGAVAAFERRLPCIVTLGFNEIIKGVIQNCEPLGAQRGLAAW